MSEKMDRQGVRKASDLEQKYQFGKTFAEVMGLAESAQETAKKAVSSATKLDENLTAEEIYNRLTNNGKSQGLYRDDDGNLWVNASYLYALDKLFAKDIQMSGTFTHTIKTYLPPTETETEAIQKHLQGTKFITPDRIPLYDLNNDGVITVVDLANMEKMRLGVKEVSSWSGAVQTDATLTIDLKDPNRFIHLTGTNMWGSVVDRYIGIRNTNIPFSEQADYVVEEGDDGIWSYRKWSSGIAECWRRSNVTANMGQVTSNAFYYLSTSFFEVNYPFEFVDVPCEVVSYHAPSSHMGWAYSQWENTPSRSGRYCAMRWSAAPSDADVYLDIYVKGRWK